MSGYRSMELSSTTNPSDRDEILPSIDPSAILITSDVDVADGAHLPESAMSPAHRLQNLALPVMRVAVNTAKGVRQFVEFPFNNDPDKQAADTLSGLEPFFWLLRLLGLCDHVSIFSSSAHLPIADKVKRRWNIALTSYSGVIGTFLLLGFVATFGFSLIWPVAFCAGFQGVLHSNQTYCKTDVMERFLTPKGMATIVQSAFLFIGVSNMMVSLLACRKLGAMVTLLREYYAMTRAAAVQSHQKMAVVHAVLAVFTAALIGIPFTLVYENMLDELKSEHSYEGYPFADIDTPLVKMENWIAYTKDNATKFKGDKLILNSLKIVFRIENFFMFLNCFAVPFFFSLMCDVLRKEWKRFVEYLNVGSPKTGISVEQLRNIRHSHWKLCKIFGFLDECFSRMILIIYVIFIVINSCIIYLVLKFGTVASGRDRFAFFQAVLMFAALQIIFYLVIQQAMKVHGTAKEVATAVRNWQPDLDEAIASEYLLLINQTSSAEVSFTAWNCFRIEESAYINAIAIIFSYILMLLQFQPGDKAN